MKYIFEIFDKKLDNLQLFYVNTVSYSFSLITPGRLGELYFTKYLDGNQKNKIILYIISKIFEFVLLCSLIIFFFFTKFLELNFIQNYIFLIYLIICLLIINILILKIFIFFYDKYFSKIKSIKYKNKDIQRKFIKKNILIIFFSVISWVLFLYIAFVFTNITNEINNFFRFSLLNQISLSIPISFMGVGLRDSLFNLANFSYSNNEVLLVSISYVIIYFFLIAAGFVLFVIKLLFKPLFKKQK